MEDFGWKKEFETGIRSVDNDHQNLFRLAHEVKTAFERNDDSLDFAHVVNLLEAYIGEHFVREERYMRRAGYPGYKAHKRQHDHLSNDVRALKALYRQDPEGISVEKLIAFLQNWLVHHIIGSDLKFVPFLTGEDQHTEEDTVERIRFVPLTLRTADKHADLVRAVSDICNTETAEAERLRAALHDFIDTYEKNIIERARKIFGKN